MKQNTVQPLSSSLALMTLTQVLNPQPSALDNALRSWEQYGTQIRWGPVREGMDLFYTDRKSVV